MPELIEVEGYRAVAARVRGRTIARVETPDAWYLKGPADPAVLADALGGTSVVSVRRQGKLLMLEVDRGVVLGLRFGMTGRLLLHEGGGEGAVVDPVGGLLYAPGEVRSAHLRFALAFHDGSRLVMVDPRRLGGVELDPRAGDLGPDAADLSAEGLDSALGRSRAALKSALMDQRRVAGLGNLLTDEVLWRARLSPVRPAATLAPTDRSGLAGAIRTTIEVLSARGGSHTGDLQPARRPGSSCPRCGEPLRRDRVGGRSTYWCVAEQS